MQAAYTAAEASEPHNLDSYPIGWAFACMQKCTCTVPYAICVMHISTNAVLGLTDPNARKRPERHKAPEMSSPGKAATRVVTTVRS